MTEDLLGQPFSNSQYIRLEWGPGNGFRSVDGLAKLYYVEIE